MENKKNKKYETCFSSGEPPSPHPHSGPGCGRINLWKCTKNQAKPGNNTLNIVFHKTGMILNECPKKMIFWPFLHFWLCQGLNRHFGLLEPKKNKDNANTKHKKSIFICFSIFIWHIVTNQNENKGNIGIDLIWPHDG